MQTAGTGVERDVLCPDQFFIVIPAYNEGVNVGRVVREVRRTFPQAVAVVVNDGSSDTTGEEAARSGATVISLPFNCGYGVALQTGLLYAARHNAHYVVTLDADGQHEISDIATLIAPLLSGRADLTLGSRYLPGSHCYSVPFARRSVSWFLSQVVSILMGCPVRDTTTGFQGLNKKTLHLYVGMKDFPDKTPDADLLLYAHFHGCRVLELPVTMHEDITGDSMHGILKSMFYMPKMFVSILGIMLAYVKLKEHLGKRIIGQLLA